MESVVNEGWRLAGEQRFNKEKEAAIERIMIPCFHILRMNKMQDLSRVINIT